MEFVLFYAAFGAIFGAAWGLNLDDECDWLFRSGAVVFIGLRWPLLCAVYLGKVIAKDMFSKDAS